MFTLIAMGGAAIDVGSWYQGKRSLQNAADAAALAGASQIPNDWSSATSTASRRVRQERQAWRHGHLRQHQRRRRQRQRHCHRDPTGAHLLHPDLRVHERHHHGDRAGDGVLLHDRALEPGHHAVGRDERHVHARPALPDLHRQQLVEQRRPVPALRQQRELSSAQRRQPVPRRDRRHPERLPSLGRRTARRQARTERRPHPPRHRHPHHQLEATRPDRPDGRRTAKPRSSTRPANNSSSFPSSKTPTAPPTG